MAKAGEKGEQKANLYLLAIVAIVAVVGIVVLVLNVGTTGLTYVSEEDLAGQAYTSSYSEESSVKLESKLGSGCKCGRTGAYCTPCPPSPKK